MNIQKMMVGPLQANCYILSDDRGAAAIIDPGGDGETIADCIERENLEPAAIIDTHGHIDHIAANAFLKEKYGCPLLIHEDDADALTDPSLNLSMLGFGRVNSPPADRILQDGDRIPVGDLELEVIATPGHSPGGICLLLPAGAGPPRLFSGDTLFASGVGRTDFPGGSMSELLDSIRTRLLTLPEETVVYPGHGPQTSIGEEKKSNPFLG